MHKLVQKLENLPSNPGIATYVEKKDTVVWLRASQVAQTVKILPATQESWVQSLGREDPPEEKMATYSSLNMKEESPRRLWEAGRTRK